MLPSQIYRLEVCSSPKPDQYGCSQYSADASTSSFGYEDQEVETRPSSFPWNSKWNRDATHTTESRFRNFESEVYSIKKPNYLDTSLDQHTSTRSSISSSKINNRHVRWLDEPISKDSIYRNGAVEDAFETDSFASASDTRSEFSCETVIQRNCSKNPEKQGYREMFSQLRLELREKEKAEEQEKMKRMSLDEKIRKLKEELAALAALKPIPRKQSAWCRGKAHDPTKFPTKRHKEKFVSKEPIRFNAEGIDLASLRSEILEIHNETELRHIITGFLESNPRIRFKEGYPFLAEGMIQKDFGTKELKVFSSRLGRVRIPDTRRSDKDNKADYVYFIALAPGVYKGFSFEQHPPSLLSAKFLSVTETVIHGFAILAHPFGSRQETLKEDCWMCWNDSLGMMPVRKRAAMLAMKKQPMWDKQLDIVSIDVSYELGFVVNKVVALTNNKDKERRFPEEVFLIEDAVYTEATNRDYVFYSKTLKSHIFQDKDRIGTASDQMPFEMVVAATFPNPTKLVFRCLLIIPEPLKFWNENRIWIRDLLRARTDAYRG